jgi:hypothetical protein
VKERKLSPATELRRLRKKNAEDSIRIVQLEGEVRALKGAAQVSEPRPTRNDGMPLWLARATWRETALAMNDELEQAHRRIAALDRGCEWVADLLRRAIVGPLLSAHLLNGLRQAHVVVTDSWKLDQGAQDAKRVSAA